MVRAILFNLPFYGHVNPTLALVAELTRRGEQITYYASETFRSAIEQAGAEFRGIDSYFTERTTSEENLVRFANTLIHAAEDIMPDLLAETRAEPPDYIVHDAMCVWGWVIAQRLRLPTVVSFPTPARPRSPLHPEVLAAVPALMRDALPMLLTGRRALRDFNAISKRLQRAYRVPRLSLTDTFNLLGDLNLVYSIRDLQPWPNAFDGSFQFVGPLLGARDAAPSFPFEALGDQPVIYVSLGTMFSAKPAFYRLCFEAFADLPHRVVLAIGAVTDPLALGPAPENFLVRPMVPQLRILRQTALFITHGGMNSINEGLAADVPLLLVPQAGDQFLNARRVERLGVGRMLRREGLSAAALRAAADELLANPAYRRQSAALGAKLRATGGARGAADAIASFKRERGI